MATSNSINGSDNLISVVEMLSVLPFVIFVLHVLQSAPSGTISLNSAFSEATLPREDSDWTSQLNRKSQDAALDAVFVSPADAVRVSLFVSYLKADAGTQSHVRPCSGSRRRGRPPLQLMSENCANQRANGPKAPCSRYKRSVFCTLMQKHFLSSEDGAHWLPLTGSADL